MLSPTPVILIINQPKQAAEFASVLEKTGSKVHAATSFEEANELLSFLHPDIIILPHQMDGQEGGDGRLYCQQVRATLAPPRPVLVLLHPSTARKAFSLPFNKSLPLDTSLPPHHQPCPCCLRGIYVLHHWMMAAKSECT